MTSFPTTSATILFTFFLLSCNTDNKTNLSKILEYKLTKLGENNLSMQIPQNYKMQENNGPDFVVYYFSPTDTSKDNIGSGGLYIGGYPNIFGKDHPDKKVDSIKSMFLKTNSTWTIFKADKGFLGETLLSERGDFKMHAFVTADLRSDLDTLIRIFSTLKSD